LAVFQQNQALTGHFAGKFAVFGGIVLVGSDRSPGNHAVGIEHTQFKTGSEEPFYRKVYIGFCEIALFDGLVKILVLFATGQVSSGLNGKG